MTNQLRFPIAPPDNASRRAMKRRPANPLQLDLFADDPRKVVHLPVVEKPFDLAFQLDVEGDQRAMDVYREAIRRNDRPADAYCNIGVWYSQSGETDAAIECFCQALVNDPTHLFSHFNLGNLYLSMEHIDLARVHYQQCTEIDPCFPGAFLNLAWIRAVQGKSEQALAALEQFRALVTSEEARAADPLLDWLHEEGQHQECAAIADRDLSEIRVVVRRLQEMRNRCTPLPHDRLRPNRLRLLDAAIAYLTRLVET